MNAIEVETVSRIYISYGPYGRKLKEVNALRELTFFVAPGELYGLLGPNGAGKTTTIKILTTLLLPTSGHARVLGHDVVSDFASVRASIGHASGTERGLYWTLSGRDNLLFFASLYGLNHPEAVTRVNQLIKQVGLEKRADERVGAYSKGMKQRLHLARALLSNPAILLLDEPTLGLDPVAAREMRATFKRLQGEGHTILLTTHYLNEAEELCDRVGIIDGGKLIAEGTPAEIKAQYAADSFETLVRVSGEVNVPLLRELFAAKGIDLVNATQQDDSWSLVFRTVPGAETIPPIVDALKNCHISSIEMKSPSLEDAYVKLVSNKAI